MVAALIAIISPLAGCRLIVLSVRVVRACLLFDVQRSSEGCEWRVVVVDEPLEEVSNEGKMGSYVSEVV